MTGFGAASAAVPGGRVVAEVRSVNARFLELKLSLPREHATAESELREMVQAAIDRGSVDVAVRREGTARGNVRLEVNRELARAYVDAWKALKRELKLDGEVDLSLLRSSGGDLIRAVEAHPDLGRELGAIKRALRAALAGHARDRRREGVHLKADMRARIRTLHGLRTACAHEAEALRPILAERLAARVAALIGAPTPEPSRLMQEVAIAIDRSDISEELARLGSHLQALGDLLGEQAPIGKRFEFLLQETLREVNTIGSKANHLPITRHVLSAKGELEKLREQIQNVE